MTEKDDFYAKMVREGLMSRAEVLQRLNMENQMHMDIIIDIFAELGLSINSIPILQLKFLG